MNLWQHQQFYYNNKHVSLSRLTWDTLGLKLESIQSLPFGLDCEVVKPIQNV